MPGRLIRAICARLVPGASIILLLVFVGPANVISATAAAAPTPAAIPPVEAKLQEDSSFRRATCLGVRQTLAQLTGIMVPFDELENLLPAARKGEVGLVGILGDPEQVDRDRLRQNIEKLQASSPVPILFGSDEESRAVQRLDKLIRKLPAARRFQSMQSKDLEKLFSDYATDMRDLGFQLAFGPVVDVGNSAVIRHRSLGGDTGSVISVADSVISGLIGGGIFPVIKHFPGHGQTNADSHDRLPTTLPLDQMESELNVYRGVLAFWNNSVGVMAGHLNVPGLSDGKPASLSPNALNWLLRRELGFDGLVITDSLDMGAITRHWNQSEAGVRAIIAGADIALVSQWSEQRKLLGKLEQALGNGSLQWKRVEQSAERVLAVKRSLNSGGVQMELCGGEVRN